MLGMPPGVLIQTLTPNRLLGSTHIKESAVSCQGCPMPFLGGEHTQPCHVVPTAWQGQRNTARLGDSSAQLESRSHLSLECSIHIYSFSLSLLSLLSRNEDSMFPTMLTQRKVLGQVCFGNLPGGSGVSSGVYPKTRSHL